LTAIAPFVTSYLVFLGLMLGSFINMAADRMPRGESIIRPRSHCRACNRQLNTIDLLPVLGYLIRGGRCATCRTPIGMAAPSVEAACGALVVASIVWLGLWPGALVGLASVGVLGGILIAAAMRRGLARA
jgi:prepilin signal peptidase PulO-like enzyme (type II secretory pathway)